MRTKTTELLLVVLVLVGAHPAMAGGSWVLELPTRIQVSQLQITVGDLAIQPIPAAQGQIVVMGAGDPGSSVTINRSLILRKLVEAGMAAGVVFTGSPAVTLEFTGEKISSEDLRAAIRRQIQPLVPSGPAGAPGSWFDLEFKKTELAFSTDTQIKVLRNNPLVPGRNQVRVRLDTKTGHQSLPVLVTLHSYGEIPTARTAVKRGTPLTGDLFDWQWLDLSEIKGQPVTDRGQLAASCAARTLAAGDRLRLADLKQLPAIEAGDLVDLEIARGGLLVTVRAQARQAGCLGQTIPVRNELNGRLVNARVKGPGLVEWRN